MIHGSHFRGPVVQASFGGAPTPTVLLFDQSTLTTVSPALVPGTLYDLTVTNADATTATLPAAWFADFLDVPGDHLFHDYIETVFRNGITAGCGGGNYCPGAAVTRAQMAVFLLKAEHGSDYTPPPCTGHFADVDCPSAFADWIEQLAAENITAGCGDGTNYCPGDPVTRAADGRLPAQDGARRGLPSALLRAAFSTCLPLPLRRLDRAARRRKHHRRMRRRQLLPVESEHARADGGVHLEDVFSSVGSGAPAAIRGRLAVAGGDERRNRRMAGRRQRPGRRKAWSGQPGSNRRHPAWEDRHRNQGWLGILGDRGQNGHPQPYPGIPRRPQDPARTVREQFCRFHVGARTPTFFSATRSW